VAVASTVSTSSRRRDEQPPEAIELARQPIGAYDGPSDTSKEFLVFTYQCQGFLELRVRKSSTTSNAASA
jgi:hypothetical protein